MTNAPVISSATVLMEDSPVESCMSLPLALEYRDVLSRQDVLEQTELTEEEIEKVLDGLEHVATRVSIRFSPRPTAADPDDDFVVDLMLNAHAHRLITYNVRDVVDAGAAWGFVVCTPGAYLREFRGE